MRRIFPIFVLFLVACPKEEAEAPRAAAEPAAIDWAEAFSHEVAYDAERGAVVVDVHVAPGFHAYTTGEETGRPLKLTIDPPWTLDDVTYPEGKTKNLPVGKSVIVEGDAEIVGKVSSKTPAPKIAGTVAYQVCTDAICDRPRKAAFEIGVATR